MNDPSPLCSPQSLFFIRTPPHSLSLYPPPSFIPSHPCFTHFSSSLLPFSFHASLFFSLPLLPFFPICISPYTPPTFHSILVSSLPTPFSTSSFAPFLSKEVSLSNPDYPITLSPPASFSWVAGCQVYAIWSGFPGTSSPGALGTALLFLNNLQVSALWSLRLDMPSQWSAIVTCPPQHPPLPEQLLPSLLCSLWLFLSIIQCGLAFYYTSIWLFNVCLSSPW